MNTSHKTTQGIISDVVETADFEYVRAWNDATLNATGWLSCSSISPQEAAMLLMELNPLNQKNNTERDAIGDASPLDFRYMQRIFNDVATDGNPRTLADWHDVAKTKNLKFSKWISTHTLPPENDGGAVKQSSPIQKNKESKPRLDSLHIAMRVAYETLLKKNSAPITARMLFEYLVRSDKTDVVIEYIQDGDSLTWTRSDGGVAKTSFKSFQNRLSKMKKNI